MENATPGLLPPPPMLTGGRWRSAIVRAVVGRLAHEFPDLPPGSIIAATVRSFHELRGVPLTTLLDGVAEIVEEQARHALSAGDEQRVPGQRTGMRPAGEAEHE